MLKKGAIYVDGISSLPSDRKTFIKFKPLFLKSFSFFAILLILFSFILPVSAAWADDEEILNNGLNNFYGGEKDSNGFMDAYDKADKEWRENEDKAKFSYLFHRLLDTAYMNDVDHAYAGDGGSVPEDKKICHTDDPNSGTPLYHNCDIPNLTTEFLQDLVSLISDDGMATRGATRESAKVFLPEIGLPSSIVKEGVPVKASERHKKYTGLELFGYTFPLSSYNGEWDHIKVMTSARAMSNFGLMDNVKMGGKAIVDGISAGFKQGMDNFGDAFSQGDFIGMATSLYSGFVSGAEAAASTAVLTILDSSDLNVANSYGWYRVNYPKTLYNARQLSQTELSAIATQNVADLLASLKPDSAKTPKEFLEVQNPPRKLKENIPGCVITHWVKGKESDKKVDKVPSPNQEDCNSLVANYKKQKLEAEGKWNADGLEKAETRDEWKKDNAKYFNMAEKYPIDITLADTGNDKNDINAFIAAWPAAYEKGLSKHLDAEQNSLFGKWKENIINKAFEHLSKFIKVKPSRNFNAPYMRFVCVDENGKDKKNGKDFVWLYNEDGVLNPSCKKVRPPVQGALFGDGYNSGVTAPIDTRRAQYSFDFADILAKHPLFFGVNYLIESFARINLNVSSFATRISNTFLNLSMTPVLDFFKINDLIVSLVESFKNSIFLPLAFMVIAASAIMILIKTFTTGNFKQGFINVFTTLFIFFIALILLEYPRQLVNAMDSVPSYLQSVIMAVIFDAGKDSDDILCKANNNVGESVEGFNGKALGFQPTEASRTLMCENWRVFALTPWVQGQWGASLDDLNDKNMLNTNKELVGNGTVDLGNGQKMNNWALYQLQTSLSGTSTTEDRSRPTGVIDPNFYRIVDLQMGPNNGEASDGRYVSSWVGGTIYRTTVTFLGAIMSVVGAVTIILYSITLIQVSVVSSLMLIALPFVLLIGLHPTAGKGKLVKYIWTLISLILQRVVLVTLLALMFSLIIAISNTSTNFVMVAFLEIVICVAFLIFKKDLLHMFSFGASKASEALKEKVKSSSVLPQSVRNQINFSKARTKGFVGGAIAGGVSAVRGGNMKFSDIGRAALNSGTEARRAAYQKSYNTERRRHGFGFYNTAKKAYDVAAEQAREEVTKKVSEHFSELDKYFEEGGNEAILDTKTATPKQLRRISKISDNLTKVKENERKQSELLDKTPVEQLTGKKKRQYDKLDRGITKSGYKAAAKIDEHNKKYSGESLSKARRKTLKQDFKNIVHVGHTLERSSDQNAILREQIDSIQNKTYEQYAAEQLKKHEDQFKGAEFEDEEPFPDDDAYADYNYEGED